MDRLLFQRFLNAQKISFSLPTHHLCAPDHVPLLGRMTRSASRYPSPCTTAIQGNGPPHFTVAERCYLGTAIVTQAVKLERVEDPRSMDMHPLPNLTTCQGYCKGHTGRCTRRQTIRRTHKGGNLMNTDLPLVRYSLFLVLVLVQVSCDRLTGQHKDSLPETDSIELSVESLVDHAITKQKQFVEEEHKKGNSNIGSAVDGNEWLTLNSLQRLSYLNAVADQTHFLVGVVTTAYSETKSQSKMKVEEYRNPDSLLAGILWTEHALTGRLSEVVLGAGTYGDLADAVTKFYENKPLLKNKPVLWVLAVPLYKELQEAKPKDQRETEYDTVRVPLKKSKQ